MAEYLLELYIARSDPKTVADAAERARAAAADVSGEGSPVRYVRAILVPEDETCFFLWEGCSAEAVREAARRAGLGSERVTEALDERKREEACR